MPPWRCRGAQLAHAIPEGQLGVFGCGRNARTVRLPFLGCGVMPIIQHGLSSSYEPSRGGAVLARTDQQEVELQHGPLGFCSREGDEVVR